MSERKYDQGYYMMANQCVYHHTGELDQFSKYDIVIVFSEDAENYIGNWVTGFGFVGVRFPKDTTRPLTDEEADYYSGRATRINSQPPQRIGTREELLEKPVGQGVTK